jgi:hypothetical protein
MSESIPTKERRQTFTGKLMGFGRRMQQVALQKMGRAEATDDSLYETRKERLVVLHKKVESSKKHMNDYLNAVRALCVASSSLGEDIQGLYDGAGPEFEEFHSSFTAQMKALDDEIRKSMDETFVSRVIEPMDDKAAGFKDLRTAMTARERTKVDFDSAHRQVRDLKEKGSHDSRKLLDKEAAEADCRMQLEAETTAVFQRIDDYEARRYHLLKPELTVFLETQISTFQRMLEAVRAVPPFPNVPEPAPAAPVSFSIETTPAATPAAAAAPAAAPTAPGVPSAPPAAETAFETLPAGALGRAKALYAYAPQSPDELALEAGMPLAIMKKDDDGWWRVRNVEGQEGMIPGNYAQEV